MLSRRYGEATYKAGNVKIVITETAIPNAANVKYAEKLVVVYHVKCAARPMMITENRIGTPEY